MFIYFVSDNCELILRNKLFSEIFLFLSVVLNQNVGTKSCSKNLEIIMQIIFDQKNQYFLTKALSISFQKNLLIFKNDGNLQKNGLKFLISLSNPNKLEKHILETFFDQKCLENDETFGSVLGIALIDLYKLEYFENKDLKKKQLIIGALSSLLSQSQSAKMVGLKQNLIKEIKDNLVALNLELSVHCLESLRVSDKKKVSQFIFFCESDSTNRTNLIFCFPG